MSDIGPMSGIAPKNLDKLAVSAFLFFAKTIHIFLFCGKNYKQRKMVEK